MIKKKKKKKSKALNVGILFRYKVKLVTIAEGDPKAPFSIATTQSCRGGQ